MNTPKQNEDLKKLWMRQLLERLDVVECDPKQIVVLGEEESVALIQQRYPNAEIHASEKTAIKQVDLVIANHYLPWVSDLSKTLQEWQNLLSPNGLCLFTYLGPDTAKEFSELTFSKTSRMDMHDLGDLLIQLRWLNPVLEATTYTLQYAAYENLLTDMRSLHFPLPVISSTTSKVLTIELIYAFAFKLAAPKGFKADHEGIVKIPLDNLKKSIKNQ